MSGRLLYRAFYWTYERGSWQWDVSCLVFIVIIFTTPSDFLSQFTRHPLQPQEIHSIVEKFFHLQ